MDIFQFLNKFYHKAFNIRRNLIILFIVLFSLAGAYKLLVKPYYKTYGYIKVQEKGFDFTYSLISDFIKITNITTEELENINIKRYKTSKINQIQNKVKIELYLYEGFDLKRVQKYIESGIKNIKSIKRDQQETSRSINSQLSAIAELVVDMNNSKSYNNTRLITKPIEEDSEINTIDKISTAENIILLKQQKLDLLEQLNDSSVRFIVDFHKPSLTNSGKKILIITLLVFILLSFFCVSFSVLNEHSMNKHK